MIKSIIVTNYLGETLELELTAPEKSGLFVQSITGIGSGKATINTTNMASNDGSKFNSARAENRNITITLAMYDRWVVEDPNGNEIEQEWSIEKARHRTYRFFPKKRFVTLNFVTDDRNVYCNGYVESNEPDPFSERETSQISIICSDPNFYDAGADDFIDLSTVVDRFQFPYSNESLVEDLTEFGEIFTDVSQGIITYDGEVETGLTFNIMFHGTVTGLIIYNCETGEKIEVDETKINGGLVNGDEVRICTIKGQKSATLTRQGVTYNILNSLGLNPDWLQIYQGDNIFTFTANTGEDFVKFLISYEKAYEGV